MYIYNITTKVTHRIHEEWVQWMKEKHIPKVMNTGCFTEFRFVRVLEINDSDGPTYAVQFYAATKPDYEYYIAHFAPSLQNDALKNWGDNFIGFRSLMELVN
ncbi:MAG: DUF4286 family protein [Bacteroidota bacterium]